MANFLHDRRDFDQLLAVVADERGLDPMLVEKDYWIMHCLWGLQAQGFQFELKGGTSLSKGFGAMGVRIKTWTGFMPQVQGSPGIR